MLYINRFISLNCKNYSFEEIMKGESYLFLQRNYQINLPYPDRQQKHTVIFTWESSIEKLNTALT